MYAKFKHSYFNLDIKGRIRKSKNYKNYYICVYCPPGKCDLALVTNGSFGQVSLQNLIPNPTHILTLTISLAPTPSETLTSLSPTVFLSLSLHKPQPYFHIWSHASMITGVREQSSNVKYVMCT